jgi:hypothetical protein
MEQRRVLGNHPDALSQALHLQVVDILIVNQDSACQWIVEPV